MFAFKPRWTTNDFDLDGVYSGSGSEPISCSCLECCTTTSVLLDSGEPEGQIQAFYDLNSSESYIHSGSGPDSKVEKDSSLTTSASSTPTTSNDGSSLRFDTPRPASRSTSRSSMRSLDSDSDSQYAPTISPSRLELASIIYGCDECYSNSEDGEDDEATGEKSPDVGLSAVSCPRSRSFADNDEDGTPLRSILNRSRSIYCSLRSNDEQDELEQDELQSPFTTNPVSHPHSKRTLSSSTTEDDNATPSKGSSPPFKRRRKNTMDQAPIYTTNLDRNIKFKATQPASLRKGSSLRSIGGDDDDAGVLRYNQVLIFYIYLTQNKRSSHLTYIMCPRRPITPKF